MANDDAEDVAFEFTCPECGITFYETSNNSDFQDAEQGSARKCPECRQQESEKKQ